jgi:hypothetical protein
VNSRNLLVEAFDILFVLTFGSQIRIFFSSASFGQLDGFKYIVFDEDSKKVERTT